MSCLADTANGVDQFMSLGTLYNDVSIELCTHFSHVIITVSMYFVEGKQATVLSLV